MIHCNLYKDLFYHWENCLTNVRLHYCYRLRETLKSWGLNYSTEWVGCAQHHPEQGPTAVELFRTCALASDTNERYQIVGVSPAHAGTFGARHHLHKYWQTAERSRAVRFTRDIKTFGILYEGAICRRKAWADTIVRPRRKKRSNKGNPLRRFPCSRCSLWAGSICREGLLASSQ